MKNTWRFNNNELKYLKEVIDSGFASGTSGNMNQRFETAFAKAVDAKYQLPLILVHLHYMQHYMR